MSRARKYLRTAYRAFDSHLLLPLLKWASRFFRERVEARQPPHEGASEWKERALGDFMAWLYELPEGLPGGGDVEPDACDLYTLLTEFTALRQEIKLQTREQNRALRHHETLIDSYQEAAALFRDGIGALADMEEKVRLASEKKALTPFLDVRDALARGLASARTVAETRSFFRRPPRGIEGVVEGYEMALRRFDRALSHAGVAPLRAVGRPFDAAFMRAAEKRTDPGREAGVVLEELLTGFVRGEEVIRVAEVVVNGK
ncbi:MAG: nucleotide exchange factor GrpE [Desulfobacterales bacterium]|nr:nucleotide exchange factor GrpE [Desulfobacterales bacterium]